MSAETMLSKCSWCGRFQDHDLWRFDRRARRRSLFSDGICPSCREVFFPEFQQMENRRLASAQGEPKSVIHLQWGT